MSTLTSVECKYYNTSPPVTAVPLCSTAWLEAAGGGGGGGGGTMTRTRTLQIAEESPRQRDSEVDPL